MGLILELQKKAVDPNYKISDLFYLSYLIAAKLSLAQLNHWIKLEMDGYSLEEKLPRYRNVQADLYSFDGSHEQYCDVPSGYKYLKEYRVCEPLYKIEKLVLEKENPHLREAIDSKELTHALNEEMGWTGRKFFLKIPENSLVRVLQATRLRVIDWSLHLEKMGIFGEDEVFYEEEKTAAQRSISWQGAELTYHTNRSFVRSSRVLEEKNTSSIFFHKEESVVSSGIENQKRKSQERKRENLNSSLQVGLEDDYWKEVEVTMLELLESLDVIKGMDQEVKSSAREKILVIQTQLATVDPQKDFIHRSLFSLARMLESSGGDIIANNFIMRIKPMILN